MVIDAHELAHESLFDEVGVHRVAIMSCHGITTATAPLVSGLALGGATFTTAAFSRLLRQGGGIDVLFLAACDAGRHTGPVSQAVSLAYSALVAGAHRVISPLEPVNDLLCAVYVVEYVRGLVTLDAVESFERARSSIAEMSVSQFSELCWSVFNEVRAVASPFAWGWEAAEPHFRRQLQAVQTQEEWKRRVLWMFG
jgi:hypothetical protein